MAFLTVLWTLTIFWTAVYSIKAKSGRSSSILPTTRTSSPSRIPRHKPAKWNLSIENLHLRAETISFNDMHQSFTEGLSRHKYLSTTLVQFYNLGVLAGVAGFLTGLFVLGLSSRNILLKLTESVSSHSGQRYVKRALEGIPESVVPQQFTINPIIPGVTVPWSHLPIILSSLFVAQCIHEIGHAISAALEDVPLHSAGFSLTLALPSAFVALSPSLNNQKHVARLRIVAAGAWHNLVLWCFIFLFSLACGSSVWKCFGYRDVSGLGRIVLSIDPDSPLQGHLDAGEMIYGLDDTALRTEDSSEDDVWQKLLENSDFKLHEGFCIDKHWFETQSTSCCRRGTSEAESTSQYVSCFTPFAQNSAFENNGRCLDPVPIMAPDENDGPVSRCSQADECTESMLCVAPTAEARLTRIVKGPPLWEDESSEKQKTVLWSGPRSQIWDEVAVGNLAPKFKFIPLFLPGLISLFSDYLATLSLSLYLFNLFSLPFLDGFLFFSVLLDFISGAREAEGATASSNEYRQRTWSNEEDTLELGLAEESTRGHLSTSIRGKSSFRFGSTLNSAISHYVWRVRWMIRTRKRMLELAIRFATMGMIGFVIIGMACIQNWKEKEAGL